MGTGSICFFEDAAESYQQALAIFEQTLGRWHPDTATALVNLANTWNRLGRTEQARGLHFRALTIREKAFGPRGELTAQSLSNLAAVLNAEGRFAEAAALYARLLDIAEHRLGLDHEETAGLLEFVARLYCVAKDYERAELHHRCLLDNHRRTLDARDPLLVEDLRSLAILVMAQDRYTEAMDLFERALDLSLTINGQDHPATTRIQRWTVRLAELTAQIP